MAVNFSVFFGQIKSAILQFRSGARHRASLFAVQLLVILVVGTIVIFFMADRLSGTGARIVEARTAINTQQLRLGALNELRDKYKSVEADLPALYGLLTNEATIGATISRLDGIADKFALKVTTKISERQDAEGIARIPLIITTSSNLDTLKRYLQALEELPFLVSVKSVSFSGDLKQRGEVVLQADLFTE